MANCSPRIKAIAAGGPFSNNYRNMLDHIIDDHERQQFRQRSVGSLGHRFDQLLERRSALVRDTGSGRAHLPQQRTEYPNWRKDADQLVATVNGILREKSDWQPHFDAAELNLDGFETRSERLSEMLHRDDSVLQWAERFPDRDQSGRIADTRHPIPCAGDLVLGDRIRWNSNPDGEPSVREGQIHRILQGSSTAENQYHVRGGSPITLGSPIWTVRAMDLFLGDVHRRPWSDESVRETMRGEAAGPFRIVCAFEERRRSDEPGKTSESRIVPGDKIDWVETTAAMGEDGAYGVRRISAEVLTVKAGRAPDKDRIRIRVLGSTGTNALPAGSELEVEPTRVLRAGRFNRVAWTAESERTQRLSELELQTAEIIRTRGPIYGP